MKQQAEGFGITVHGAEVIAVAPEPFHGALAAALARWGTVRSCGSPTEASRMRPTTQSALCVGDSEVDRQLATATVRALRMHFWALPVLQLRTGRRPGSQRPLVEPPLVLLDRGRFIELQAEPLLAEVADVLRAWQGLLHHALSIAAAEWNLTEGEVEVLRVSFSGIPRASLRRSLHLSEAGVKWRIRSLLQKTGSASLPAAVQLLTRYCFDLALRPACPQIGSANGPAQQGRN